MPFLPRYPYGFYALITGLLGLMALPGCTGLRNEVDPAQLRLDSSKVVVSCFLSPQDSVLAVKVTRSSTVVGDSLNLLETGNNITDATVTLSEGDRSVQLFYNNIQTPGDSLQPYYSIDARLLPIRAGRTYKLTVQTTNRGKLSSTCTIPQSVTPTAVAFDSLADQSRRQPQRYYVRVRWQDPAGQTNAYQVAGIFRYTVSGPNFREEKYNSLSFDDDNRGLFTDAGVDGTTLVSGRAFLTLPTSSSSSQPTFSSQFNTASVIINLMSVEQTYYRYQEAAIRQRRSRNNPFAEPVLIPSNIEGGLGCFAGYNNATITMKLK